MKLCEKLAIILAFLCLILFSGATRHIRQYVTDRSGNVTWNDEPISTSFTWTYDLDSGTDPVWTISDGSMNLSAGTLKEGGTDVTVTSDFAKDIVAGVGLTGSADNVLYGTDSDVTLAIDTTEITGARTWGDNSDGSMTWTWDVTGATHPSIQFGADFIVIDPCITVARVITNWIDASGAVDMDYGSADITDHTFVTDSTGDSEIVLPDDSIGPAEMASGAYDFGTSVEADTLTEGGVGVYNTTESDAAYQPLEATLTDIADGTIDENLVNTANPWAVNEGGTGTNTLTDGGILLGSGTGAVTALGVAANGQIPIGDGTTDPQLATISEGLAIDVTNAAASITIAFDPTELTSDRTWGDNSDGSMTWTWDVTGATHPSIQFGADFIVVDPCMTIPRVITNHLDASGAVDMDYGSTDITDHTFVTDSTGDSEIVLPDDSIGPSEMASGAYDFGTSVEADTITEGGVGVYNTTESDAAYQPLEATLTDIADGTIDENLVNTANPWAVNEGGTGAATFTDGGILLGSGTGAFTALGVATNGQIPIGDGTTDPQLATISEGLAIDITNAAASITVAFDPTEITSDRTWGDNSDGSMTWTWDVTGATHPSLQFGADFIVVDPCMTIPRIITNWIDASGAVDLDYGSADVTDHTFITDGTGTAEIVLPTGSIDGTEILDDTIDSADYAAGSIDAEHIGTVFGAITLNDDDTNAMAAAHAYLANQDGFVHVYMSADDTTHCVIGYVDTDSDPVTGGTVLGKWDIEQYGTAGDENTFMFPVRSGQYFEVTATDATVTIRWQPFGTLIPCTDQD